MVEHASSVEGATQQLRVKEFSKRWREMRPEERLPYQERSAQEFASQRRARTSLGLGRAVPTKKEGAPPDLGADAIYGCAPVAAARQEGTRSVIRSVFAGSLISGFVVEKPLGHGSYGSVYQAASRASGRRVALKLGGLGLQGEAVSDLQAELDIYKLVGGHHLFLHSYGGSTIAGEGSMAWLALEIADGSLRQGSS